MDTVIVGIKGVLVFSIFALVVWFYRGSHKRKTIKETTSKADITKPKDLANMSATTYKQSVFLPSLQKPTEETAMSATLQKRSVSQTRDCTSVSSKGNEKKTSNDEVDVEKRYTGPPIKETASKAELTKLTDEANMSATTHKISVFLPSLQKPTEETAMSSTLHKRNASQPIDSTSVPSKGYEEKTSNADVDVRNENNEEIESREDSENIEFDKYLSFVRLDVLRREMAKAGNAHGLNQYIRDSLDAWKEMELNVAVTGNSGVGKSSLINALRKLTPSDKNAATVGVVETTTEGKKYTYPENKHVSLWDLPGIGTLSFTKQKYMECMNFSRFDVVIIVSASRFLKNDIWLGKKLLTLRKNILFVRTKIDLDIMNAQRDHPDDFTKAKCMETIRNNITGNIRIGGIANSVSGIFLMSSPDRDLYDFAQLDETLKSLLSIKGQAIRKLLENPAAQAIKANQAFYKEEFKARKIVSVIYGFLPIPLLERGLGNMSVSSMREQCLEKFCIDDASLDKIADELGLSKDHLKRSLKSYRTFGEGTLLTSTEDRLWPTFIKFSKYIFPVVGSFLSAKKTYTTLQECLKTLCDEMAEDELNLVQMRLYGLETELQPL